MNQRPGAVANALAWDHNAYYHGWLLRQLPHGSERVLDLGCGSGRLAAALAARVTAVDAVDRSADMIRLARARVPCNVRCIEADAVDLSLPADHYDAVACLAALHHMPFDVVLRMVAAALRPGGVFAAIGLYRPP